MFFPESDSSYLSKRYGSVNLLFLTALMDAMHVTVQGLASRTPNPNAFGSNLRRYLKNDDIKLSKAKEIVSVLGYELTVHFKEKLHPEATQEDILKNCNPSYTIVLPEDLSNAYDAKALGFKNIGFLYSMMRRRRITKLQLAKDLGLSTGTVFAWFQADDIYISYLNRIQELYGVTLEFSFTSLPTQSGPGAPSVPGTGR